MRQLKYQFDPLLIIGVRNNKEENDGYVVFKIKYPWISWEMGWLGRRRYSTRPRCFIQSPFF
jgi:hypothetical protein